jgi:4-phytase / acid phosphatase
MGEQSRSRGSRRRLAALRWVVLASAACFGGQIEAAGGADSVIKATASAVPPPVLGSPILTVIVTRHGVRSFSSTPHNYDWSSWGEVEPSFLTNRGYDLMKQMGVFYAGLHPAACKDKTAFVYADKDQRTLYTAQALVKGLCGASELLPVYHEQDLEAEDPIFNPVGWLAPKGRVDTAQSKNAVVGAAGEPPSAVLLTHAEDLSRLQHLLDSRCGAQCAPVAYGATVIAQQGLAELKGPLTTASTYAEDLFLEYAQCRPAADMAPKLPKEALAPDLKAAMRLHVLAYDVNARNAYNPLARGGTLFAHIVAMLDKKIGRVPGDIATPPMIGPETALVILSGHDTQLGALGGILQAHWKPDDRTGIVPDDMPPGSALHFELFQAPSGEYRVGLRFAAMTLARFRAGNLVKGGVETTAVTFTGCESFGCTAPIEQFESLVQSLEDRGFVDNAWAAPSILGVVLSPLVDPPWTKCGGD